MDRVRAINTAINGIKQAIPDIHQKLLSIKPSLTSTEKSKYVLNYTSTLCNMCFITKS